MLRRVLLLTPAFAFAVPFASPLRSSARPLATEVLATGGCSGDCDDFADAGDEGLDLGLCVELEFGVAARACEVRSGPACLAVCTFAAVGPACLSELGDRARPRDLAVCKTDNVERCRSQCDAGGAAFCSRDHPDPGLPDGDRGSGGEVVFVDLLACIGIGIDAD